MRATAMVLTGFNQPLQMQQIDIPALQSGQALLALEAAGVCGSDVHMLRGEDPRTPLPIILGHEGVGRIADLKGRLTYLSGEPVRVGDRVAFNRGLPCGRCYWCRVAMQPALCPERGVYGINLGREQAPYLNGCYATHLILRAGTDLFHLDEGDDPAALVSAACSGATAAHCLDVAPIAPGDTVVVQGPGPLGAWAAALARQAGAGRVMVIGGSANRLALCGQMGATDLLNRRELSQPQRRERVLAATHGRGADVVIEATGSASAVSEGLSLVRRGGAYVTCGFSQPAGEAPVDFFREVVSRHIRIQGVWVSDARHMQRALDLGRDMQGQLAMLADLKVPLERADEGLAAMAERRAQKAVIVFDP